MHASNNLVKQEFLTKWIAGLRRISGDSPAKSMNVMERKNAIKLSADIAIAAARRGVTCWSRAIIAQASSSSSRSNTIQKLLARRILNKARYRHDKLIFSPKATTKNFLKSSERIFKRTRICTIRRRNMNKRRNQSSCLAKNEVKKRAEMLKNLVPGGDMMDDQYLIRETLDYIVYLRAQVEVMRTVAADSITGGRGAGKLVMSNDHRNNNLVMKK